AMVLRDDATGTALSCTSSTGSGGLNGGTSPNRILGTITALTFTGCTGPQGQPFTITMERLPFYIGPNTYNATTGVLHGIIYRVSGAESAPGSREGGRPGAPPPLSVVPPPSTPAGRSSTTSIAAAN